MPDIPKKEKKRCSFCRRIFLPDPRVGNRQKSCARNGCRKQRKNRAQKQWVQANPGYWRVANGEGAPDLKESIQDGIIDIIPGKSIALVFPKGLFEGDEAQDEIWLKRQSNQDIWIFSAKRVQK
jgi:hypothetical protein